MYNSKYGANQKIKHTNEKELRILSLFCISRPTSAQEPN